VAQCRILDAIALAAGEQGHRLLLTWSLLAAVVLSRGSFASGFFSPAIRRGGASV
jgi:hypothetical protein